MRIFILVILALLPAAVQSAECSHEGQSVSSEGWSRQIRRVCLTNSIKANYFPSPDRAKILVADLNGFHLTINGNLVSWPEGEQFLARGSEVSWSPLSSAFFINSSDGSDPDGWSLKVYSLADAHIVEHTQINQSIAQRFRTDLGCSQEAVDPNVRGLGWSRSGGQIFAFAQAAVNEPCGQQGDFRGVTVDVTSGAIQKFYSETSAKEHFHSLLPYNMR